MLDLVNRYIRQNDLFSDEHRLLLAVSGGIDSMVLAYIALESGWNVGIAHCNFQLRGDASDGDEAFVAQWAQKHGLPFYVKCFDTLSDAGQRGVSIQMAARDLRYEWLESVRAEQGYDRIVTAHHLNDAIETFLYNLSKGSGLRGLQGIPPVNGYIVRPMLGVGRGQIEQYAIQNEISYREDASNAEDKYARNFIRHHLAPGFQQLNPAFEQAMSGNIQRIKEARLLMLEQIEWLKQRYVEQLAPGVWRIQKTLANHPAALTVLHEWLAPLGFSSEQLEQVLAASNHQNAYFQTPEYRLVVDRLHYLVEPLPGDERQNVFIIKKNQHTTELPGARLLLAQKSGHPEVFPASDNEICVDAEKLDFPLILRHWKEGDWFCPIGMEGKKKKLQDFFSDAKLSRFEKEKVWMLTTQANEIVWIVGHRLDDRFKISTQTNTYFQIIFEIQSLYSL